MEAACLGFSGSGVSTLFDAISGPGGGATGLAGGRGRLATIAVPDARVDRLRALCKPKKTTYAGVRLRDISGLPRGGGNTANQLAFMVCDNQEAVTATVIASMANDNIGVAVEVTIGLDSTTAAATGSQAGTGETFVANRRILLASQLETFPGVGFHTLTWLERSTATGTSTWVGDSGAATRYQSGISGHKGG